MVKKNITIIIVKLIKSIANQSRTILPLRYEVRYTKFTFWL
jgi:hypothetical protein